MIFASGFTWFTLVEGLRDDRLLGMIGLSVESHTNLIFHAMLACSLIVAFALLARLGLNRAIAKGGLEQHYADDSLTSRNVFEMFAQGVISMLRDLMSKEDARLFFPLIATLFLYILTNNMLALVPGLSPATDNINTNVGMSIVVFGVFLYVGLRRDPVGFLKHLWGPMFITGFLIFPVEVLGLLLRPVSLSLRLTGNMFGDHTAFSVVSHLAPIVPVAMLGLALFVSFMQAFVFSLLTAVYISMSMPHTDGDH